VYDCGVGVAVFGGRAVGTLVGLGVGVKVSVGGMGVGVKVGGSGVFVGVSLGGTGVGVSVGGTSVAVSVGVGVVVEVGTAVEGIGVWVGGIGIAVEATACGVCSGPHAAVSATWTTTNMAHATILTALRCCFTSPSFWTQLPVARAFIGPALAESTATLRLAWLAPLAWPDGQADVGAATK
jgi:hypothetical protein